MKNLLSFGGTTVLFLMMVAAFPAAFDSPGNNRAAREDGVSVKLPGTSYGYTSVRPERKANLAPASDAF
jgi:hypothetical protein